MTRVALFISLACLAGCTDFPELDGTRGSGVDHASYPKLRPLDGILQRAAENRLTDETGASLAARAAALRWKAAKMRGRAALSPSERASLLAAIARHHR